MSTVDAHRLIGLDIMCYEVDICLFPVSGRASFTAHTTFISAIVLVIVRFYEPGSAPSVRIENFHAISLCLLRSPYLVRVAAIRGISWRSILSQNLEVISVCLGMKLATSVDI